MPSDDADAITTILWFSHHRRRYLACSTLTPGYLGVGTCTGVSCGFQRHHSGVQLCTCLSATTYGRPATEPDEQVQMLITTHLATPNHLPDYLMSPCISRTTAELQVRGGMPVSLQAVGPILEADVMVASSCHKDARDSCRMRRNVNQNAGRQRT